MSYIHEESVSYTRGKCMDASHGGRGEYEVKKSFHSGTLNPEY